MRGTRRRARRWRSATEVMGGMGTLDPWLRRKDSILSVNSPASTRVLGWVSLSLVSPQTFPSEKRLAARSGSPSRMTGRSGSFEDCALFQPQADRRSPLFTNAKPTACNVGPQEPLACYTRLRTALRDPEAHAPENVFGSVPSFRPRLGPSFPAVRTPGPGRPCSPPSAGGGSSGAAPFSVSSVSSSRGATFRRRKGSSSRR